MFKVHEHVDYFLKYLSKFFSIISTIVSRYSASNVLVKSSNLVEVCKNGVVVTYGSWQVTYGSWQHTSQHFQFEQRKKTNATVTKTHNVSFHLNCHFHRLLSVPFDEQARPFSPFCCIALTAVTALILDRTDQLLYHQRLYTSSPSDSSY